MTLRAPQDSILSPPFNILINFVNVVLLGKSVQKVCSKFTGENPCQCAISIKLQSILLKSHVDMGVLL